MGTRGRAVAGAGTAPHTSPGPRYRGAPVTATCGCRDLTASEASPGESPFSWNNKTYLFRRVTRPFGSPEGVLISLLSVRKDLLFSRPHSYGFHGLKVQGSREVASCLEASVTIRAGGEPGKGRGKLRVLMPCGGAGGVSRAGSCVCAGGNGGAAVLARNAPEAWAGLSTAPDLCLHTPGAARGKPLTSRTQDEAPLLPCTGRAEVAAPGDSCCLPPGITWLWRWSTEKTPFLASAS